MVSPKFLFVLIIFHSTVFVQASSRVSFSRPGEMIRIPSVDHSVSRKLLNINLSHEFLSSSQGNSSVSIHSLGKSGYQYGMSFVKPENPVNSIEMGFHFQKNMLVYANVYLDVGIHDLLFRQSSDSNNGLVTEDISLFAVLSSYKIINDYTISTHCGLGTGKIIQDSHSESEAGSQFDSKQKIGAFIGFQFKTPLLQKNGGVDLLTEFDGMGLNIGIYIPISKLYQVNLGITHFENLGDFAREDDLTTGEKLEGDDSALSLGLTISFPRLYGKNEARNPSDYINRGIYSKTDSSILFYNPICTEVVETLRDSIRVGNNMIENLDAHNIMLLHQEAILVDSTRKSLLREEVGQSKQNKAMRHLSRSLRFFYDEHYRDALSEINIAIKENPGLAIAYGRRGSIYYKLGDIRRATINWNAALQLDPEFTEIYDILKASDENRLNPVEISKNFGEN